MDIKVLVATHKKYRMPLDDMYVPVQVGKALHPNKNLGYELDNVGDNISKKNPNYCELTALYWAWKNLKADAIGLVHYRRYLSKGKKRDFNNVLSKKETEGILKHTNIILPKKRHYLIETNYSHYIHAHHELPLIKTKMILKDYYPEYVQYMDNVLLKRSAHMFNMFIMRQPFFNEYCKWLFDILFKLEKEIDISSYSLNESRVFGFISEIMFDIWLNKNKYNYIEVNAIHMERVNWLKKGGSFLIRKFKNEGKNRWK